MVKSENKNKNQVSVANMQAHVRGGGSSNRHISLSDSEDYRLLALNKNTPPSPYRRIDFSDSRWWRGSNLFSVYVVSLELPQRAYVQLSPYNTNKVLDLVEEYEKNQLETQKGVEWSRDVGSPCLAYYTDGRLYRAYIMESVDSNSRKIRYVDFGNCDVVQIKDIFQIPVNFLNYPEGATLCSVGDLVNAAVLDEGKLKSFIEFKDFKCRLLGVCLGRDTNNHQLLLPFIYIFDEISKAPVTHFFHHLKAKKENVPPPDQIEVKPPSELVSNSANTNSNEQAAEICEYVNTVVIQPTNETQVESIINEKCVPENIVEQEVVVEKKEEKGPEEVEIIIETNEKAAEPKPEASTDKNEVLLAKTKLEVVQPDIQQSLDTNKGQQEPQKLIELEKGLIAAKPNPEVVVVQPEIQQSLDTNKCQQEPQKVVEVEKVLIAAKPNPTPEVVQHDIQKSKSLDTTTKGKEQVKVNLRPSEANIKVEQPKRKIATTMPGMSEPQEVILDLELNKTRRESLSKTSTSSACVVAADLQKENTKPKILAPSALIMIKNHLKANCNVLELEPHRKMQKYINKATFTDIFNPPQVSLDALDGHGPTPTSASNIALTSTSTLTHDAQKQAEIKTASKIYVVQSWDKTMQKCEEQHDRILEACIKHQEKIIKAIEEHEQKWDNELRDYQKRFSTACDENRDWIKKEQAAFAQELVALTEKLNNIYENVKKCEIPSVVDE